MKQNRIIALLLAAAMSLSLLCGAAWGAQPENPGDGSVSAAAEVAEPEDGGQDAVQEQPEDAEEPEEAGEPEEIPEPDPEASDASVLPGAEQTPEPEAASGSAESEEPEEVSGNDEADEAEAAEDASEEGEGLLSQVNPAYENLIPPEEQARAQSEAQAEAQSGELTAQGALKARTKLSDAGADLRKGMKRRKKVIKIAYRCKSGNPSATANSVFREAMKHTGKPDEGDYLYGQWKQWYCFYRRKRSGKRYTYRMSFYVTFFTSAAQEKKTDAAVKKILNKLALKQDSNKVKVSKIYNYLCANVVYDYAGAAQGERNLLCHSAYAAAVKKKAVCQGYALLFYRLMLEAGVPARYITGKGDGESHAWNIVRLGGKYYNADATWDAGQKEKGKYFDYYLRSNANFSDHVRYAEYRSKAFYKAYPMSAQDGNFHIWEKDYTVDVSPTCTQTGSKSIHCADCGLHKNEKPVPAAGHQWLYAGEGYSQSRGCVVEYYVCSVCGQYGYIERKQELAYAAAQGTIRAQNVTRSWSAKPQRFSLGARSSGGQLSYASNQEAVQVSASGRVTVSARYAGRAVITIRAAATQDQPEASRRVTVTVRPRAPKLCRLRAAGRHALCVKWKKEASAAGYEVQYSTDRHFRRNVKRVKVERTARVTLKGLKRGRRCYVRVRSLTGGACSVWSGKKSAGVK